MTAEESDDLYLRRVYHEDDPASFVRRTDLPDDLRVKVEKRLNELHMFAWTSLAYPDDHFFMRDNRRLPLHCYTEFVERVSGGR